MSMRTLLRAIPTTGRDDPEPVSVYERNIQDFSADIANAQRRVDAARAEIELAKEMLRNAQSAFIEHCKYIELPLEISPTQYPSKPYVLED